MTLINSSSINYILLGKNIKKCRLSNHLSYRELSDLCNISVKTLRNVESANSKLSISNLISISNALNVSIDYLLMDSLENKSEAIHFMLANIYENLSAEESAVVMETGNMIKLQMMKFYSIK